MSNVTSQTVKRGFLRNVSPLLIAITIALGGCLLYVSLSQVLYQRQQQSAQAEAESAAKTLTASGTNFLVQGTLVDVKLTIPKQPVRRGDSFSVVLHLEQGPAGPTSGVADERDGQLTPTLSVGDCQVTPEHALPKDTTQPIAAFVWEWSVDDCKSSGDKAVQTLLLFTQSPGTDKGSSDPLAYRSLEFVTVADPLTLQDVLSILTIASGVVTLVAPIFAKMKLSQSQSTAES